MRSYSELLAQIDPAAARPYLEVHGWQLETEGELGNRWSLSLAGVRRNIAVPRVQADPEDSLAMLHTAVRTLGEVEGREPELVARDLEAAANDVLEFRVIGAGFAAGEIPLPSAPEMTGGVYEAVQAAARAEVKRRPHYAQGNIPAQVRSFVDEARLLGTAKGSVVLRVRPPVAPAPAQEVIDGLPRPESYERRVIRRLITGVRAAKAAAHRDPTTLDIDALDEGVGDGLSANLCRGLRKLAGGEEDTESRLELRVRWSLVEPVDEPSTEIEIGSSELDRFEAVEEILRGVEPYAAFTAIGPVIALKRDSDEADGRISIEAMVDLKVRTVHMEVGPEEYDLAMEAHKARTEIRATGTLEHAGTSRELTDLTSFEKD